MTVLVEHDDKGNIRSVAILADDLPEGVSISRRVEKGSKVIETDLPANIESDNRDEIRRLKERYRVEVSSGTLIPKE